MTEPFVRSAADHGVALTYLVRENTPHPLEGDPGRIRQILFNLVGNSVKFTEKGEVRVEVWHESLADDPEHVKIHFSVADTGIGIPSDEIEKLFQPFTQMDGYIPKPMDMEELDRVLGRVVGKRIRD